MKLEKAIEGLIWLKDEAVFPKNQDDIDALNLGIEALKRLNLWRECGDEVDISPLPGETKDGERIKIMWVSKKKLRQLLKEAYERGINKGFEYRQMMDAIEARNKGMIFKGIDVGREIDAIVKEKKF